MKLQNRVTSMKKKTWHIFGNASIPVYREVSMCTEC